MSYATKFLVAFAGSLAISASAIERDERESIRSARVFHIMKMDRASLEMLYSKLAPLPRSRLLAEFQRLAKKESIDHASGSEGGDLGVVAEGVMDEKFEEAVFAQMPMVVSMPIQSKFGWHLVLVDDLKSEPIAPVCAQSLKAFQRTMRNMSPDLLALSLRTDNRDFHPDILKYIGSGWSSPINWGGNLTYIKLDRPASQSGLPRVTLHTEFTYAMYQVSPRACCRSVRREYVVDCKRNLIGLTAITEYEGRGASGRELSSSKEEPRLSEINGGFHGQLRDMACAN